MKVLVVDDSVAYRRTISQILGEIDGVDVVGEANHGQIAMSKLRKEKIDLITLDLEMPVLDGLSTLRAIKEENIEVKIIIFAAQTSRGAKTAMEAFRLGASDLIPKPKTDFTSINDALENVKSLLLPKIIAFKDTFFADRDKPAQVRQESKKTEAVPERKNIQRRNIYDFFPRIVVIGSSTGGPRALEDLFSFIKGKKLRVPIVVAQHMPAVFTTSLAKRLQVVCDIETKEAENKEVLAKKIYIAPGDFHTEIFLTHDGQAKLKVHQGPRRNHVRPSVDHLFESSVDVYGADTMGFVLTGMGNDGEAGCVKIKECSGGVMIQEEKSCTVWGMPRAVFESGCYDSEGDLQQCGDVLLRLATQ